MQQLTIDPDPYNNSKYSFQKMKNTNTNISFKNSMLNKSKKNSLLEINKSNSLMNKHKRNIMSFKNTNEHFSPNINKKKGSQKNGKSCGSVNKGIAQYKSHSNNILHYGCKRLFVQSQGQCGRMCSTQNYTCKHHRRRR